MNINASFTIAGWIIATALRGTELTVEVTHKDGTPISETGADIGGANELGYRFTSEEIEAEYRSQGDADAPNIEGNITIDDWKIDIVVDEDDHLNLYVTSVDGHEIEHDSLTHGTSHSKSCDLVIDRV
jgi:hypothetical protein